MDYRRALDKLREQIEETPHFGDFLAQELRLEENLKRELRYGSSEATRQERAEVVDRLNDMARATLGITFNDLLFGRSTQAGLASPKISQLWRKLKVDPTPSLITPPVQTKLQRLPFNELSWEQFELLCAALVAAQGDVIDCHLYGVRGEDQKGIDIVATHERAGRRTVWAYQCKRYQMYSRKLIREALEKLEYKADVYIILLSIEAGSQLRDEVSRRPNSFIWDARDLSRKLKGHPQIVEDFFGPPWRRAFAG